MTYKYKGFVNQFDLSSSTLSIHLNTASKFTCSPTTLHLKNKMVGRLAGKNAIVTGAAGYVQPHLQKNPNPLSFRIPWHVRIRSPYIKDECRAEIEFKFREGNVVKKTLPNG